MIPAHSHAEASRGCAAAIPLTLLDTSASAEWTSLLLNNQEGAGETRTFETCATQDLSVTVAAAGRPEVQEFLDGRWRSAVFQPGIACLTAPGETARVRLNGATARETYRTIHVYLPGSLILDIVEEYRRIGQKVDVARIIALPFRDEMLAGQVGALLAAARGGAPDLYAAGAARWMVTHLLLQQVKWREVIGEPRSTGIITDRRLARVIEYMSCHLQMPLTLDDLAREAGISVHHFGRRFRERIGMGPAAYLTELRVERARLLLGTTSLAIADIGARCGYPRPSAFSTAFLRHVGVSPTAYRASA